MNLKLKQDIILNYVLSIIFAVAIITLAWFVPASSLISLMFVIIGILVIICSIPELFIGIRFFDTKAGAFHILFGLLNLVSGIMLICFQNQVVLIIVSIMLILMPLIDILTAKEHKKELQKQWVKMLIGILLLAFLPVVIGIADKIIKYGGLILGIVIIVIATIYLIKNLHKLKVTEEENKMKGTIDVKGEDVSSEE